MKDKMNVTMNFTMKVTLTSEMGYVGKKKFADFKEQFESNLQKNMVDLFSLGASPSTGIEVEILSSEVSRDD